MQKIITFLFTLSSSPSFGHLSSDFSLLSPVGIILSTMTEN